MASPCPRPRHLPSSRSHALCHSWPIRQTACGIACGWSWPEGRRPRSCRQSKPGCRLATHRRRILSTTAPKPSGCSGILIRLIDRSSRPCSFRKTRGLAPPACECWRRSSIAFPMRLIWPAEGRPTKALACGWKPFEPRHTFACRKPSRFLQLRMNFQAIGPWITSRKNPCVCSNQNSSRPELPSGRLHSRQMQAKSISTVRWITMHWQKSLVHCSSIGRCSFGVGWMNACGWRPSRRWPKPMAQAL